MTAIIWVVVLLVLFGAVLAIVATTIPELRAYRIDTTA